MSAADGTAAAQCTLASSTCPSPFYLLPTLGVSVSPQELPANGYMPVHWGVFGKIATRDGAHPSALRKVALNIDKDVRINSRHYPVCKGPGRAIGALDTQTIERVCRTALVGRGKALVELAFPEREPTLVSSPLLVINAGEESGATRLLIHLFIPVPRPSAVLTEVEIRRNKTGLHTISNIPVIAGGSGSLLSFKFNVGKTYSYKGEEVGYFEAKCPDSVFKASIEKLLFKNEVRVPGVAAQAVLKGSLAVPCTPKRWSAAPYLSAVGK